MGDDDDDSFDWASKHSHSHDPNTSIKAAASAKEIARKHRAAILKQFTGSAEPLAAEQIGDRIGLDHVQVNRRISDLKNDGVVVETEYRHRNRSGRGAVKWRLNDSR